MVASSSSSSAKAASARDLVRARQKIVPLPSILSIRDFEEAASQVLPSKSFAFFRTGADDERALQNNRASWPTVRFRPRILRPMATTGVDLATDILGSRFAAPFFIAPAGGGKLAHPTGEVLMTRAAADHHILQWVCNAAGCTQEEMAAARAPRQVLFWQIYAMQDLAFTEEEIQTAVEQGYKGFALTVDAVTAGNRERDRRQSVTTWLAERRAAGKEEEEEGGASSGGGPSRGISAIRKPVHGEFDWDGAIRWLRSLTDLPIAIKGIQTWEDAQLCLRYPNVHPWLSNHGGRQLEDAPSALDTLLEIHQHCPEVLAQRDVIVDGGVLRGTDIVKALCLGARAVGLGRAFLYALAYGHSGVSHAIQILLDEVATTMALLGVTKIADLGPQYVAVGGSLSSASPRRPASRL